jgi:UDP-GlcNAc3NAcA epimerase
MLAAVERALLDLGPSLVLVYGDTNSTLAGALAAAKLGIPVAHVEAGLRSFARSMPEEINRIVADHVSAVLFPPTPHARDRLLVEGLADRRIVVTGDVMYDAVLHARGRLADAPRPAGLPAPGYVLATIHRAENTDDPARLGAILDALEAVSREVPVILPLHPRTRDVVARHGMGDRLSSARLGVIEPVGYLDMQRLEAGARLIVTDSGGVQKEAYWHGVPCVTVRDQTEWTELVEAGWNVLAPPGSGTLVAVIRQSMAAERGPRPDLFGDGTAGDRVAVALEEFLRQGDTP